ncbi:O-antigen ligase family protein [Candidatus Binatia bacterium]|nr:O-antigen ligase family protein [Candidatus Binatia bacterium]
MTADVAVWLWPAGIVALAALLAWWRPALVFPMVLIAVPLRLPVFPEVEIATLLFVGAVLGRATHIVEALLAYPGLTLTTAALPAWFLASALWARQAIFVFPAAGKWLVVWLAMALVLSDETLRPKRVVVAALAAMVPMALWGAAERLHVIAPLGDQQILRNRAIELGTLVRGRALFWHPNRLAEFVEQLGLLLVGCGTSGLLPLSSLIGALIACLGVWGTDSKAGLATMVGGGVLVAVWLSTSASTRRRATPVLVVGLLASAAVVTWAYVAHGGVGTRTLIYRYAWKLLENHPLLGVGGGNWALAVGMAPLSVSRFWFRSHAHSLPLQLAVEVGLVGLGLGVLFFASPVVFALRRMPPSGSEWRGVTCGALAGVLGLLAHNLVHYFLRDPVDGITTGLLLGLAVRGAIDATTGSSRKCD